MNKKIYILFFLFFTALLGASSTSIDCLHSGRNVEIDRLLQGDQTLVSVSFDVDFFMDDTELRMITGLQEGQIISSRDISSACFYLEQKSRFSSISLDIQQVAEGVKLQFHLVGKMIFAKLNVHGYLTGKYKYKNAYILNEGDLFDVSKHQHSLKNIEKIFREDGYYKAKIKDEIFYDYRSKSAVVSLHLDKSHCCRVDRVILHLDGEGFEPFDLLHVKKKIEQFCNLKLKGKYCSKRLIDRHKEAVERFLYRRGLLYSNVDLQVAVDDEIRVVVSIELDRKKEFVFFGNHHFTKQDFLESLLLYGKSAWHFPATIISDELKQMYHSKGFWSAEVTASEEDGKIFCVIHEGKRVRVVGIEYGGVESFLDEELTVEGLQDQVVNKLFDKKNYDLQKQKIVSFYKKHGYWDAFIDQEEFHLLHDSPEQCIISLQIDEGRQRLLKSISVPGHEEIASNLRAVFEDDSIIPFDYSLLADQKSAITSSLKGKGYKNISVSYSLDDMDDGIDLVWKVHVDKDITKFGRAVIVGDSFVAYHKLSREFMFEKGELWDREKLDNTAERLREIGIFDSVHIYPGQVTDRDNERPVLIKIVDADKYEARLRVGFQHVGKNLSFRRGFGHKVGGSFFINNPFKVGDKVAIHADSTTYYGEYSIQYQFPWLFKLPLRSEVKIYNNYYRQPVYAGSNQSLYRATQQGMLLGVSRNFEHCTLGVVSGVELMGLHDGDVKLIDQVIDYEKELVNKKSAYLYFEPSIVYHNLDNILNPSSGSRSTASCKGMFDFASKVSFFKLLLEQSFYKRIMQKAILAVRGRVGHVFNQSFNKLIPIERFYLGGVNSIRGYYRDYCPPFGLLIDPIEDSHAGLPKEANNLWKYAPQGGRTMIALNVELRVNLYQELDCAVFTDMGVLFKDSVDAPNENFVGGAGFGLRYNTPVGPLRFDIAWKWKTTHKDFEPAYIWYLTFGQAF